MRYVLRTVSLIVVLACGLVASAAAQSGFGSISGTVVDETGGALTGAKVEVLEVATGAARTATSNEAGLFTVPAVPPGNYVITISRTDFKSKQFENVLVNSFQQVALGRVTLDVAIGASEVTEVTAAAPMLDLDSGVRLETIQAKQVQEMPLQGRNWSTLLKVIPGANPTNNAAVNGREYSASGYADFRINGKNSGQTQVNLDGGSLVDHGSDGKTTVAPSLESIHEVSILTNNFQAEYGNRGGTVINIVTKSGTNNLHGALFDYIRNEALNANSWQNNFVGEKKPPYRYNYFGGNLGGPIRRNRLFFFYNVEKFQQKAPGSLRQGRVPTELERRGDFSQTFNADGTRPNIFLPGTQGSGNPQQFPNRVIPQSMISPLGQAILNAYPLPNNPDDPVNNYRTVFQQEMPRWSNTAKVDWMISDRTQAYVRFTADDGTQIGRDLGSNGGILPAGSIARPRPDRALTANATHTFSPTLVMSSLFGWSYDYVEWNSVDPDGLSASRTGLDKLPSVFPVTDDILPAVQIGTYPLWHFNRIPAYARANEWQAATTFTWARGRHVIKFGGQTIINLKDEIDQSVNKGSFDFRPTNQGPFDTGFGPANVLVGAVSAYEQLERVNRKNSIYRDIHAFVQDTWKVGRALTLDYGVRLYHMPTEHNRNPGDTLDGVFLPSRWDPSKAPRYYIPDPKNPRTGVIDPANPNTPVPVQLANVLRYTIVPGSGDPMNGVVPLGGDAGSSGIPHPRALLFAPRGGFAWLPFDDDRTLVRGGFGWAYNRNNIADTINNFENKIGQQASIVLTSFDTMATPSAVQPIRPRSLGARDESNRNVPTVYDYSLSVQRQLGATFVVDVAYVGNQQRNQPINFNLNAILPGTAFLPEFVDPGNAGYNFAGPITAANPGPALPGSNTMDPIVMRPYRGFDALTMTANIAKMTYNALQVSLSRRQSRGLAFDVSYTLASLKGEVDNAGLYNFDWQDYTGGQATGDRRHVVSINYSYDVPKVAAKWKMDNPIGRAILDDWKIAHLVSVFSGQNYSPGGTNSAGTAGWSLQRANDATNVDLNRVFMGTPDLAPRPVLLGDPNDAAGDLAHQFDPNALGVPAIFPLADGTGPRNFLRGRPGFSNDLSLIKPFRVANNHRLELRADIYNIFNSVRRVNINSSVQYKANGRTFADGFRVFNTPEQNRDRLAATGVTNERQLFNQYRTGAGHVNLTEGDAPPMRIIQIGIAYRF